MNIVIRAELRTPILMRQGDKTLDGLLAAALFDRTGDLEQAHAQLPLRCTDGLWNASSALLENAQPYRTTLTAALHADHDLNPAQLARVQDGKYAGRLIGTDGRLAVIGTQRRREFGNVQNPVSGYAATAVWWFAETEDMDAVRDLFGDLHFVGKKHTAGYGQLGHTDIEEGGPGGLLDPAGYPLRPIPAEHYHGAEDAVWADAAWRPAYWKIEHRARCAVPTTTLYTRDQLEAML